VSETAAQIPNTPNSGTLPPHVEESVRAVERLHSEHHDRATPFERALDRIKHGLSAPKFIVSAATLVIVWIAFNCLIPRFAWDPPPFPYLELVLSGVALFVTVLILGTQQRADTLAVHREQLILQLGFVSEQKATKIVSLLEELRRDSPQLRDRVDPVAEQMTESVDPKTVSDAIRNTVDSSPTEEKS
jgi:uncharacterized membrane protein